MNAKELRDEWESLIELGAPIPISDECRSTILRALDLLVAVEESGDELVRQIRECFQPVEDAFPQSDGSMLALEAAARIVAQDGRIKELERDLAAAQEWREAVLNELIVAHIYTKEHDNNPRKTIHDAITWNCQVALDPAVSTEAQSLIKQERDRAELAEARAESRRLVLHEITEEWAGAECGEPVTAQEAYAIQLAKRMYQLAVRDHPKEGA